MCLPGLRDEAAFHWAQSAEASARGDLPRQLAGYKAYLDARPSGRHAAAAEQRIRELCSGAQSGLKASLAASPEDSHALATLALISWGFDSFDHTAWGESELYANKAMALNPSDRLAAAIRADNGKYEPERFICLPSGYAVSFDSNEVPYEYQSDTQKTYRRVGNDQLIFADSTGTQYIRGGKDSSGWELVSTIKAARRQLLKGANEVATPRGRMPQ